MLLRQVGFKKRSGGIAFIKNSATALNMSKDWNKAYADGITPWDKGAAAPPLLEYLANHRITGSVLVPGCGTGHDVKVLAATGAIVTGMDLAPLALKLARLQVLQKGVRFLEADFLTLPISEHGAYDWVIEHTCLCALDPQQRTAYASSVRTALRTGGFYWAIFFSKVNQYDGQNPPHPITATEIDALFDEGFELIESYVPDASYPCRPNGSEIVRLYRKT